MEKTDAQLTTLSDPVACIGVGKIGEALVAGWLRAGLAPDKVLVVEHSPNRITHLSTVYGIQAVSVEQALKRARTIVLAVKPQDLPEIVSGIAPLITPEHLIVSVAAGISTSTIESLCDATVSPIQPGQSGRATQVSPATQSAETDRAIAVVRVMPNTAAQVDLAMSAVSAGKHASSNDVERVMRLFKPIGAVVQLPERHQDAVTALSGSGPAYFFFLVEAMIDAGILLGLSRDIAATLIVQTALGAATMLRDTGQHPVQLREAVTSPGGTTIAAIRELENHGVRAALIAAIEAAWLRSKELGT